MEASEYVCQDMADCVEQGQGTVLTGSNGLKYLAVSMWRCRDGVLRVSDHVSQVRADHSEQGRGARLAVMSCHMFIAFSTVHCRGKGSQGIDTKLVNVRARVVGN